MSASHENFREVDAVVKVRTSPALSDKIQTSLRKYLSGYILKYIEELQGVVLAFRNERPIGDSAKLCPVTGYLCFNSSVTLIVFKPKLDAELYAEVNLLSETHIGALVYNIFNASMSAEPINGYSWNAQSLKWISTSSKSVKEICMGSRIKFKITELINHNKSLFIKGSLEGLSPKLS